MTAALAQCGTYGSFQRHRRAGETPCQPCRDANAAYQRQWRHSHGALSPRVLMDQRDTARAELAAAAATIDALLACLRTLAGYREVPA